MADRVGTGSWSNFTSVGQRMEEKHDANVPSHTEHLRLAGIVKGVHADLRNKYKKSTGETELERIWYEHCQDKTVLSQYADAMHHLAVDHWAANQETRIDWCREVINHFFKQDGLKKVIDKEKRRTEKQLERSGFLNTVETTTVSNASNTHTGDTVEAKTECDNGLADVVDNGIAGVVDNGIAGVVNNGIAGVVDNSIAGVVDNGIAGVVDNGIAGVVDNGIAVTNADGWRQREYNIVDIPVQGRMRLLDVGSCFNAFLEFVEVQAVGIDISPATESVYHCDFLNLRTTDPLQIANDTMTTFINNLTDPIEWLPKECFHVVVFSLLLEYFPAPYQRWVSCQKAHDLLMYNGILVIVTPDSSHQNRNAGMMKSWKVAIESIGFKRWRYVKQEHLHCLVFRKIEVSESDKRASFLKGITPDMIYIPQDFHTIPDVHSNVVAGTYSFEDEQFYREHTLHELPSFSSESDENNV